MPTLALLAGMLTAVAGAGLGACSSERHFREPLRLGGQEISPDALEAGRVTYLQYCRACHGESGDGRGPASFGLRPPPRDFRQGLFKFASVESGALPTDDDLRRIVRRGLAGTAMLPWDVPAGELDGVIAYIKTFSPKWARGLPGKPVPVPPDPWNGDTAAAVARGRDLYHVTTQCSACHPHYATPQEEQLMMRRLRHAELAGIRDDMYGAVRKDSEYRRGTPPVTMTALPPDFRAAPLRAGDRTVDLYRTIAAGIGGTAMPAWANTPAYRDAATGEHWDGARDIWALAHYVRSLVAPPNRAEGAALR